jgi:hypothetical protein
LLRVDWEFVRWRSPPYMPFSEVPGFEKGAPKGPPFSALEVFWTRLK